MGPRGDEKKLAGTWSQRFGTSHDTKFPTRSMMHEVKRSQKGGYERIKKDMAKNWTKRPLTPSN